VGLVAADLGAFLAVVAVLAAAVLQEDGDFMAKLIDQYFTEDDLQKISAACSQVEQNTCGEIRVCIYNRKPFWSWGQPLKRFALTEFFRLGMHRTRDKTGILLLILLSKRRFQIIADAGIHTKVAQATWDEVAQELRAYFRRGAYLEGVLQVIHKIGSLLALHFPRKADDINELSDEVVVK